MAFRLEAHGDEFDMAGTGVDSVLGLHIVTAELELGDHFRRTLCGTFPIEEMKTMMSSRA